MTKYPSLYAALEPADRDGHRGSIVRCTASRKALGFVWWSCKGSNVVTWHFVAFDAGDQTNHGTRNTERNAVQALRDVANFKMADGLPFSVEAAETEPAPAPRRRVIHLPDGPVVTHGDPPPAPAARIVWPDEGPTRDITAAVAAALRGVK